MLAVVAQGLQVFHGQARAVGCGLGEQIDQRGEGQQTDAAQPEVGLDLLHGRTLALTALLPIERQQHADRFRARAPDEFNRLADRRARRDHVIDDHHASGERPPHHRAAFAVIFGFLAIEGPRHIARMVGRQRQRGRGHERNPLVRGAEQHVEGQAGGLQGVGITAAEHGECLAVVEPPGVEKIGTLATRLEGESAEAQRSAGERELDEAAWVRRHAGIITRVRVITLNVNGIRSAAAKGAFVWLREQQADVICLQETKAHERQLAGHDVELAGYHRYFFDAERPGYAGTALYCRQLPDAVVRGFGVAEFDREGRYLEARFGKLAVVSLYLPSGSAGPERQASKFRFLEAFMPVLRKLRRRRSEYILCGDWNIAHREIDLKNWKSNQKNSGFLPEERAWMDELLGAAGYVDAFREVNAEPDQYTWWSNRGQAWSKNVGWRIDYQIVSGGLAGAARAAHIHKASRFSDHAPLILDYHLQRGAAA